MLLIAEQSATSIDALEQALIEAELAIGRLRSIQARALGALDQAQVARMDGARSLSEWVAARLDVTSATARGLAEAARQLPEHPDTQRRLAAGEVSFDRAVATARLAASGASENLLAESAGFDLAGVQRLAARRHRTDRADERATFRDRYLVIQPTLDEGTWRLWGELPAGDGAVVETALTERGDRLRPTAGNPGAAPTSTGAQRRADALVSIALDSLEGGATADVRSTPVMTVFVDAATAGETDGEAGAEIAGGPRIGPAALEEILCTGAIQVVSMIGLTPIAASATTRAIPPATRRAVLYRDGGCVVAGCRSRYRLQPHHVIPYSRGGSHHPDNLATLCWYHHHVAIHGAGFRLDPDSPPQRRRLLPPTDRAPP